MMALPELKKELLKLLEQLDPYKTYKLDNGTTIINVEKFVNSHLKYLESNPGNKRFMPYYLRLLEFFEKYKK